MPFRFRIGPFTVGRSGVRLSKWGKGGGASIPLTGRLDGRKGKSSGFGVARIGPARWHVSGPKGTQGTTARKPTPTPARAPQHPCSSCGQAMRSDARFCGACGRPAETATTCPNCGASVLPDARFCDQCAARLA